MFEFDWSIVLQMPAVYEHLKRHYGIVSYDAGLNKFWLRDDYHMPQSLDYEEIIELFDGFDMIINEEGLFFDKQKRYRSTIVTPVFKIATPFFYDRNALRHVTIHKALKMLDAMLIQNLKRPLL